MSAPNDGGPAFPIDGTLRGMTLRDYVAAEAIGPVLTGSTIPEETWSEVLPVIGRFAYAMADAMLKARQS